MQHITVDTYPEQESYWDSLAYSFDCRRRQDDVSDAELRLSGALTHLAHCRHMYAKFPTFGPWRDLLYAEYAVQTQERLLAAAEYALFCAVNRVAYRPMLHWS